MGGSGSMETEIKLAVADVVQLRQQVEQLGFRLQHARTFEGNDLLDTADLRLRREGIVLRLREFGERSVLTFKGSGSAGKHKVREEIEVPVVEAGKLEAIFGRLGYRRAFRYEKYRTEYTDGEGMLTIDETPIGNFLELEGEGEWIDRTAARLGYEECQYITLSYGRLYASHCEREGIEPTDMVFGDRPEHT